MTLGLGDRPCWDGILSPPSSPVSLPVSKGVEITLTAWWRQTTKEERFELCLSGCFFFLVLAGNRRHPHGTLWRVERTGYTRIFKAAPNSWGARHHRIELTAHCYMSSLGQPQGRYNTRFYPPSLSTRTLSGPSSQGIRTQQGGELGRNDLSTCPSSVTRAHGEWGQCPFHLYILSTWQGRVFSYWWKFARVMLGAEAWGGVVMTPGKCK